MVVMAFQVTACSKTTESKDDKKAESIEISEEDEDAQAKAQADADEISAQHADDNQDQEAVERADFGRAIPYLEESENWKRTESTVAEGDVAHEVYQCDAELEFLCESAATDNADVQAGMESWISGKGCELVTSTKNDALSESLQKEVYSYEALQDNNGYSIYHQGVYFVGDGCWYAADFSVMEGEYGDYSETISGQLNNLTLR